MRISHCPECHSTDIKFFEKRNRYSCNICGCSFSDEMQEAKKLRIFLSYGHDDNEELVRLIKADLEKRGHDVWFDKNEIKSGDEWRRSITDGILGSNRVLSFLSKHSTRDPGVCRDEIAIAIGVKGGNIQTILVESEQEVQPPVNIGHIQWLDMHIWHEKRTTNAAEWEQWYKSKLAEIVHVVESDETRRFAGEIEKLSDYLKPIKSDARIYSLLKKGFYGRDWLFDAVEKWRQNTTHESRLFWIMGDPGIGKSAFAAQLTHTRSDIVIAAQFCEWDKPDHRDARRVVCSIAFQLATRLPDYRKLLLTLPEIKELDRKDASELFDYLLANPLRSIINGGRERYLIIIDALDEAGESGRNPLVEMLARNAHHLPNWLGMVVTSRPEFDVKTPFQALNPISLDTKSELNKADIRDYLNNMLATQLKIQPHAEVLVNQILEKSEGVFLYVERFCDDVEQKHISLDHPDQFPQGLGGIFAQYFQRQLPDLDKFRKEIRPALRAIIAAREPLPLEILQKLFNWKDEELRDFIYTLGSLFPVSKEGESKTIKPYHKSLADWMGDETKAGVYFVSMIEGHRMLAQFGWNQYLNYETNKISLYVLYHLPYHLVAVKRWNEICTLLCDIRFTDRKCQDGGALSLLYDFRLVIERLPESKIILKADIQNENPFTWTIKLMEDARYFLPTDRIERLRIFGSFMEGIYTTKDGSLAITLNSRGAIEQWDLKRQRCIQTFRSKDIEKPSCINITSDGKHFLIGGFNALIQVIHFETGSIIYTLKGHCDSIAALSMTEDGCRLVSASTDNTLIMWDIKKRQAIMKLIGHTGVVTSLSITPDSQYLVSGGWDRTIIVWNLKEGKAIRTLRGHSDQVKQVKLSFDGTRIVSLGQDGTIRLWDINSNTSLQTLRHTDNI